MLYFMGIIFLCFMYYFVLIIFVFLMCRVFFGLVVYSNYLWKELMNDIDRKDVGRDREI